MSSIERSGASGSALSMSTTLSCRSGPIATGTRSWAKGCAVFISEPRFDKLPGVLETGRDHGSPAAEDVALAKKLRARGKSTRARVKKSRR